jgi:predicted acetyltransferase
VEVHGVVTQVQQASALGTYSLQWGMPMRLVHRITHQDRMPTSDYDFLDDAGEVVGFAQLRHRPSCSADLPPEAANNVYYEIAPAHRGRGHGKTLLALVLVEARRIGLDRVRLAVDDRNTTSRHIIESAGGQLVNEFARTTGELCRLFEIPTAGCSLTA